MEFSILEGVPCRAAAHGDSPKHCFTPQFFPKALPQTRHRLLSLKRPKEQHDGGKATPNLEEN